MSRDIKIIIIICIFFLLILGAIGVQKYNNIVNPHKAFEKDLNKSKERKDAQKEKQEIQQEQGYVEQEQLPQQRVELSDSFRKNVINILLINLSFFLSIFIIFDFSIPQECVLMYFSNIVGYIAIKLGVYIIFKFYNNLWKYASINELSQLAIGTSVANILSIIFWHIYNVHFPRGTYVLIILYDMVFIGGIRLSYRIYKGIVSREMLSGKGRKRVLIIGAGDAGAVEECNKAKCKVKILPGMYELIDGKVSINKLRDVKIEDLLGREPIDLDVGSISEYLEGKVVLVTGGGGSIGSELCRQIAKYRPKELIILDVYENNAYNLQNELNLIYNHNKSNKSSSKLNMRVIIASIGDRERIDEIFREYRPDVIFHAAAHKHVPLMEDNPKAAINNNIFGTLNLVESADKYGVKKFVLISTDKAVNPVSVMGATKRVCEMIVKSKNYISDTDYVAVRFGNVLGSNGSVVPLFKNQITQGGPVTVTDPEMIRYFMTIPEAAQLVLEAGGMAEGGEIFVLDMGEPVKILKLAEDLIRLSGLEPYVDIPIEITGLRPGEKLFEELLISENVSTTKHEKIFVEMPMYFDFDYLLGELYKLKEILNNSDRDEIKKALMKLARQTSVRPPKLQLYMTK